MVAGKVKAAMGFQRSPPTPQNDTPIPHRSSARKSGQPPPNSGNGKTTLARSFGVYFPRSSAQVQPRPPDVAELLRIVEELQERESSLRTQLLEQKVMKGTVSIVPSVERELKGKDKEVERLRSQVERLERENDSLRHNVEQLKCSECSSSSSSVRFQGLIDASSKSKLLKGLMIGSKCEDVDRSSPVVKENAVEEEKEIDGDNRECGEKDEILRQRPPRIPIPPPFPSTSSNSSSSSASSASSVNRTKNQPAKLASLPPIPPPLPQAPAFDALAEAKARPPAPPPPPLLASKGARPAGAKVRRVPEVVEFYHSLMRRDSKKELSGNGVPETAVVTGVNARDMIGEIANRSSHLLAIKTDVETQGEFIKFLIKVVENAVFTDIEDVVAFVKWLDNELSFLVDERAVLKHFDWPESKADAMREAAFGYCDLKKLEGEVLSFQEDPRQPYISALKKMQGLFEKLEQAWYNLSRIREGAIQKYRGFRIPWDWMLDTGYVNQIKLASVKLAMKYMKRVSSELQDIAGSPEEEELMLLAVRFAFRVHQFAGGFDMETMRAFQELKDKARSLHLQGQSQNQHTTYFSSTSC